MAEALRPGRQGGVEALVVGASGLVGGALLRVLQTSGEEAVGTCFRQNGRRLVSLDITDGAAVMDLLRATAPEVVYLPAAMTNVDYCESHPDEAHEVNARGVANVARATAALGGKLIYYSTDYIFDGKAGPYPEEAPPSPTSAYGRSKLAGEEAVRAMIEDHLILRSTVIYGWDRTSKNFAMQVSNRLSAGLEMKVAADQVGNPTLADYLAEVSLRLVQSGQRGVINVVGNDRVSRADFGRMLARAFGLNPEMIRAVPTGELGQSAPRPLQGGLVTTRLRELLGTEPLDLSESLKRLRRQWRAETHTSVSSSIPELHSRAESLKEEIFAKVREYYELVHKERPFIPFRTRIPYSGRVFDHREMVSLADSMLDFWLTLGPYGEAFEAKMRRYFGAPDLLLVNSGSSASLLALSALLSPELEAPLKPGDEVITPAVTFPTTLAPIVQAGLVPVFVDAEVGTYNIDPELIEGAVSPSTRAIVSPHTLGNPCHMEAITGVSGRHNLLLIEDCCDALGATYCGKLVGTFGELATLSFYPAHHITMGEGGGVVVNRPYLSKIVRSLRDWGRDCWCAPGESNTCGKRFGWCLGELPQGYDHKYIYSRIGYNLKPTDLQAAIGMVQADRIQEFAARRQANFQRLYRALEPYQDYLILPKWSPRAQPSWFAFPITVTGGVSRRDLVQWLEAANIETRLLFAGNILRQPGYRAIPHRVFGSLDQSDRIMRDTFFIGVYPGLTEEMMDFVIERFHDFFRAR